MSDRNTELHFGQIPSVDIQRSRFQMNHDHKTTMNEGDIVPIMVQEVLPGDTFEINLTQLVRMSTPIYPVMDNCHIDTYAFFVPNRLIWEHWKEFCGENNTSYWEQQTEYTVPQVTAPENGWLKGTIADYMGIPIGIGGLSVSALPFRAYAKIYNDWFWNQNLFEPLTMDTSDSDYTGSNVSDRTDVTRILGGGFPARAGRISDYFSTALPEPQKGPDVEIPLGNTAPVVGQTTTINPGQTSSVLLGNQIGAVRTAEPQTILFNADDGNLMAADTRINFVTDLSQATGSTLTALRNAIAVQHMYEKNARSGTRYIEFLKAHFGVTSSDARLDRAEYLGGGRTQINMTAVTQTSSTDATTPQGNVAGMSMTIDNNHIVNKSFEEHGILMVMAVIRIDRTYQQGIERFWSRKNFTDFYLPVFANLSEQAILNKEIYAQGTDEDDEVFGYQEPWGDYRYKPNRISGELRSTYSTPLDSWHYGDEYNSLPVLGRTWFEEDDTNIDRTLAIQTQDQFIADFYFSIQAIRPMPIYGIPGLDRI